MKHQLTKHPDFSWTSLYIPHGEFLANLVKKVPKGPQIKFGVEVPKNAKHVLKLDSMLDSQLWKDSVSEELDSINKFSTFVVLEEGEVMPAGYIQIPYHLIFDVKFDLRHKCRLVAGGHRTPDVDPEQVYSGVVSIETIRLAFVLAAANQLDVCAADISTAFLYGKTREKVFVIAGPEFGEHCGKRMIIDKGLYGLKTSAARFHESLSAKLRSMGFRPCKADFDFWYRPKDDHYEYLATYVDDILAFSKDPMAIINDIQSSYMMKGIGVPEYYL